MRRRAADEMYALAAAIAARSGAGAKRDHFRVPAPPPGVLPDSRVAMDYAPEGVADALAYGFEGSAGEGLGFLGYPVLAELLQRPEYRRFADIFSEEMTRKFIRIVSASDDDQSTRIRLIYDEMERVDLKGAFRRLAFLDCAFGRAHLYPDLGPMTDDELASPLVVSPETVPLNSLRGFRVVEPYWVYPARYDARDPMREDFYRPRAWYVMGREYHASRLLTFVGREVPDLLKPAYGFGGLSLTQMAKPYVDNWVRTRQNVADAVEQFSQSVLSTDMESVMEGGAGEELDARIALYNAVRSSRGMMAINRDTEEFEIAAMPLGTLDHLQAQSQEQLCSVAATPLVKYLGITPSGLNASSDGEVRAFFDTVAGQQVRLFGPHMRQVLDLLMQSALGEVHDDISYSFEALWQLSETERANVHQTNATVAKTYIDAGVLAPEEERRRLATEEDGLYQGLDPDDLPDPPAPVASPGGDPSDPFGGASGPGGTEPERGGPDDVPATAGDAAVDPAWFDRPATRRAARDLVASGFAAGAVDRYVAALRRERPAGA